MFVLVRAVTYAALFIGLVLIYVPARLLSWSGIFSTQPRLNCSRLLGWLLGPLVRRLLFGAYSPSQLSEEALRRPSIRLADS